jgi:hypothetical protein
MLPPGLYCHAIADQIGGQLRQPGRVIVRPAELDRDVPALDVADLGEPSAERRHDADIRLGRAKVEHADHRHHRLLRACRKRPRDCCAAQ